MRKKRTWTIESAQGRLLVLHENRKVIAVCEEFSIALAVDEAIEKIGAPDRITVRATAIWSTTLDYIAKLPTIDLMLVKRKKR